MTLNRFIACCMFGVLLATFSCAPHPETPVVKPKSTPAAVEPIEKDAPPPETKDALKDRLDAARNHVRQREVLVRYGFWTVFHAILGMGPERTFVKDADGKVTKAIDYICAGSDMPGLEFRPMGDAVEVVTRAGNGDYQGHQDQYIAEMAQWGMPETYVFTIKGKKHTFKEFIQYSRDLASVTGNQELSWAVLIIGQYYGTDYRWTNLQGEKLSLEDVVKYEISKPIGPMTACGGTHRLFGLSWVYHLHRKSGGKKEGVWKDLVTYVDGYKQMARDNQNRHDGSFSTKFIIEPDRNPNLDERINTTGHVFEWLSLALPLEELRAEWMEDAANTLAKMILDSKDRGINAGGLYHATHGLEIYRTRRYGPVDEHGPMIPPVPKD